MCMRLPVLTALIGAALIATPAQSAVTVDVQQVGSDVVGSVSGSLNLDGLKDINDAVFNQPGVRGDPGYFGSGPAVDYSAFTGLVGPLSWGAGAETDAPFSSGDPFAINANWLGNGPVVFLSSSYVSGAALSSSATFSGTTLAALGLNPGSYVYSSGFDTVTVNIIGSLAPSVPEPSTWALIVLGFGFVGGAMRFRRKKKVAVSYA